MNGFDNFTNKLDSLKIFVLGNVIDKKCSKCKGYGKKINIDEVGIREFQANSSKVKNIDSFAVIPFIDETNVNVPDTVPQDLVDEVERERLRRKLGREKETNYSRTRL